ncbi:MAG: BrnA antitoxin family protein [Geminicoccaceae bacterium]
MSDAADDDDSPELTDADFARARPFPEMFPELAWKLRAQGGRPRLARPKVHVGFRLAAEVVEGIKATGKGYNARVERVLREALEQGKL